MFRAGEQVDRYRGLELRGTRLNMGKGRRVSAKEETEMRHSEYYLKINANYYIDAAPVNSCYARYANDNKDVPNGNNSQFEKEAHFSDPSLDKCLLLH